MSERTFRNEWAASVAGVAGICYPAGVSVEARSQHSFRNNTPSHVSHSRLSQTINLLKSLSKKIPFATIFLANALVLPSTARKRLVLQLFRVCFYWEFNCRDHGTVCTHECRWLGCEAVYNFSATRNYFLSVRCYCQFFENLHRHNSKTVAVTPEAKHRHGTTSDLHLLAL